MLSKDDVARITDLLTIVEKIANVAPGFMSISGEAMTELKLIDKDLREKKLVERPVEEAPSANKNDFQSFNRTRLNSNPSGQDTADE